MNSPSGENHGSSLEPKFFVSLARFLPLLSTRYISNLLSTQEEKTISEPSALKRGAALNRPTKLILLTF